EFGTGFRCMRSASRSAQGEALGEIELEASGMAESDSYTLHPALLDACLHTVAAAIAGGSGDHMYLPVGVEHFAVYRRAGGSVRSHARVRSSGTSSEVMVVDVRVLDRQGRVVAILQGVRCQRVAKDVFRRRSNAQFAKWLHEIVWKEADCAADSQIRADG